MRSNSSLDADDEDGVSHPVEPRSRIPVLPPVLVSSVLMQVSSAPLLIAVSLQNKIVDTHPACWLEFTEDAIITSCKSGKSTFS